MIPFSMCLPYNFTFHLAFWLEINESETKGREKIRFNGLSDIFHIIPGLY